MGNLQRPMILTEKDYARITAALLDLAAEEFNRHGCNEFDLREVEGLADPEKQRELDRLKCEWNGDPSDHDPTRSHAISHDDSLMRYLADWWRRRAAKKVEVEVELGSNDSFSYARVKVLVDGQEIAGGRIGGEPEDNSYHRDYDWIDVGFAQLARALGAEAEVREVQAEGRGE